MSQRSTGRKRPGSSGSTGCHLCSSATPAAADDEIIPFAEPDADAVARLTQQTLALGLCLGDRACIALAIAVGAPAVTADRLWSRLTLPDLVVERIR